MRSRNWFIVGALAVIVAAPLSGCGDNDNEVFLNCGNATLDGNEQCDDGNAIETDNCLSTCRFATCGDGFIHRDVEECDGSDLNGQTCNGLGLGSGTLRCDAACEHDTSGCGNGATPTVTPTVQPTVQPTPTTGAPTATPTDGGPTATATGDNPTPTPTSTPTGATCQSGQTAVIELTMTVNDQDIALGGVQLQLAYPENSVRVPGTGGDPIIGDAVDLPPGLPSFNDQDTNGNLIDDRLDITWVTSGAPVSGTFATITFECIAGQSLPSVGAFACTVVSASDETGTDITGVECNVTIP